MFSVRRQVVVIDCTTTNLWHGGWFDTAVRDSNPHPADTSWHWTAALITSFNLVEAKLPERTNSTAAASIVVMQKPPAVGVALVETLPPRQLASGMENGAIEMVSVSEVVENLVDSNLGFQSLSGFLSHQIVVCTVCRDDHSRHIPMWC